MSPLSVLSVASECWPLVKTGGLADVVGALPAAVAPHDIAMTAFIPGYPAVLRALERKRTVHRYASLLGAPARILACRHEDRPLLVLDAPAYFDRDGGPYSDAMGRDWLDNGLRFAALAKAAADIASGQAGVKPFDVLHAHDWQAGLAPAYLVYTQDPSTRPASVMTIHNMAFQGYFGADFFHRLELPPTAWSIDGVEYHGGVGMLKAGLMLADAITTVSPGYAEEIRKPEFGMGLEGLINGRQDRLSGIVNGIDTREWNARTDPALPAHYSAETLEDRAANKRAVEAAFGLEPGNGPLFTVISRLTWQKGMDVLLEVLDHLVGLGGRLALLGTGDSAIEAGLHAAAARHPGRIGIRIGYDEPLAHLMQGGCDAILIPSRFEPCGLTQLYGLAYGCVPVVARTGGLGDTVVDANVAALAAGAATGIQFSPVSYEGLSDAITRTVRLFADRETWAQIQRSGMLTDFSWAKSGRAYAALYRRLKEHA
ncbi:glycogen synthase [Sphingobium sp. SYK-6]|uniref:glycogen synthase GlgA n=1 Tax=Sphingobium sp. (strain NBRC 103272 / SYK-6) TaxID=627192 RepID=UPI0002276C62|nr:glycogen synthase GlgA [Sphingobium sp. SYK-6]BAK65536.1 glycogen synthase [Sphingobium sp. SYK-6]